VVGRRFSARSFGSLRCSVFEEGSELFVVLAGAGIVRIEFERGVEGFAGFFELPELSVECAEVVVELGIGFFLHELFDFGDRISGVAGLSQCARKVDPRFERFRVQLG